MTNAPQNTNVRQNTPAKPETVTPNKQAVLNEIRTKWDKFSEEDMSALRGRDDLIAKIVAKYALDRAQVQQDVDALLNGRQI
jgi:hypothetical protein